MQIDEGLNLGDLSGAVERRWPIAAAIAGAVFLASIVVAAVLPDQFDEYIWFNQTGPVTPFATHELEDMPDTYPFGL